MVASIIDPIAPGHAGLFTALRRRNMPLMKGLAYKEKMPVRTANHSSPAKCSAQNRAPSQPQSRATVDQAIKRELAGGRIFTPDLADHMFGHLVSTELAQYILEKFVADGVVILRKDGELVPRKSPEVTSALDAIFVEAKAKGLRSDGDDSKSDEKPKGSALESARREHVKKPTKSRTRPASTTNYSFSWVDFPSSASDEDKLVEFLNKVVDLAWEAAKSKVDQSKYKPKNRFAAPKDKRHGVPLSYEPDGEDMRPDFLLLPIEAFHEDGTVKERYINFTTALTVGEMKTSDLGSGLTQVHRYARGLRRAQPWVHFVVALTVTKDKAALLRGDGSGTERLEWSLSRGRGCTEFIRTMLGIALAKPVDLGQNPAIKLGQVDISTSYTEGDLPTNVTVDCNETNTNADSVPSEVGSSATFSRVHDFNLRSNARALTQDNDVQSSIISKSYRITSSKDKRGEEDVPIPIREQRNIGSSASKRSRVAANLDYENNEENRCRKKKKTVSVELTAFVPLMVYGHECYGILFTSSSIRGRGTTVFCVVDLKDKKVLLALKMSWQDLARESEQKEVMDILEEEKKQGKLHPNVLMPIKTFKVSRNDKDCTTLGGIRNIPDKDLTAFSVENSVENRLLTISISELKRPAKYFWGAHDFVRGLRGAVLGHEYLTSIGILHRDISENNIVLGRYPGEERGYLIDFDMAIREDPEKEILRPVPVVSTDREELDRILKSSSPIPVEENRPLKALRTGTTPYMSLNVLGGKIHTYHDDLESFLYVLLFFFLSYAGPLSKQELNEADSRGFTQQIGSGRFPHIRSWPEQFNDWVESDLMKMEIVKNDALTPGGMERVIKNTKNSLRDNWPDLHKPITVLLLRCWRLFVHSRSRPSRTILQYTTVEHCQLVQVLDEWLEEYSGIEENHSNCPFR